MIQVSLFGIGILLLMASWKYMLHPSMLDSARDRLFDLRENVRTYFISSGKGLEHPAYGALRALINSHLRYTEEITFGRIVAQMVWLKDHEAAYQRVRKDVDKALAVQDATVQAYAREVRIKSALIVMDYAVKTSLAGIFLSLIGFVIIYAHKLLEASRRSFKASGGRGQAVSFAQAAAWSAALFALSAQFAGVGREVALTAMEEGALHASEPCRT
ncbi:MAG: hypothetical protein KIT32_18070 [Rhodocyclaceae bacterium]|nr:hypothetical protein [Rhodocyclaceae bacterium]